MSQYTQAKIPCYSMVKFLPVHTFQGKFPCALIPRKNYFYGNSKAKFTLLKFQGNIHPSKIPRQYSLNFFQDTFSRQNSSYVQGKRLYTQVSCVPCSFRGKIPCTLVPPTFFVFSFFFFYYENKHSNTPCV